MFRYPSPIVSPTAFAPAARPGSRIQVLHLGGVGLDKRLARLDLVAHERCEELVGHRRRLDRYLQQRTVLRVHRRLPELDRVHLPEALEAADVRVAVGVQSRQRLLKLAVVVDVVVLAVVRDLVERRLRDVHVAGLYKVGHVPEQERQHQRPDVAAVAVGVGHQHDLVVPALRHVEGLPHAGADGADHGLYLDVGEDLVHVGLLDVEDLAAQRQDGLEISLPALLGQTPRRVALDDVQLAPGRVLGGAVCQLARQRRALQVALADRVPHLARRLTGPRRLQGLVDDRLRLGRMLLQELGQELVSGALDEALDLGVPQLGLGLALELRLAELHRDDGREPLADVVAGEVLLLLLDEPLLARVGVDGAREGRPEAGEMRPALVGVDVVGEREYGVLEAVVPLHRDLDGPGLLLTFQVEDALVDRVLRVVYVRHEVPDAALVLVRDVPVLFALVDQADLEVLVQERRLAEAPRERVERELHGLREDLGVGHEADGRPGPLALLELTVLCEGALREAALVALAPHVPLAPDLELEPLRERVHYRGADAVQAAGDLVTGTVELAAGVQRGHDDLCGGLAVLLHLADGQPAAVVGDGDGVVRVDGDEDLRAIPGQRIVDGLVHDLPNEMVKTPRPRRPDVHAGTAFDRLEPLEDLDRTCIVRAAGMLGSGFSPQRGPSSSHVPRKKQYRSYLQRFAPGDCNTTLPFSQRSRIAFCAYLSLFVEGRHPLRHTTACSIGDAATRYAHHAGPPQNLCVEIIEVGGGHNRLGALQKIPGEKVPPALVELAHNVVEEQDRVLPRLGPYVVPGGELESERCQPLLPLRSKRREVYPA